MVENDAAEALRQAEAKIAKLATTAAADRNYDSAERLLGIARYLGTTADKLAGIPPKAASSNGADQPSPSAPAGGAGAGDEDSDDQLHFERDGSDLIKRGKSKGDEKSYEHKAPRAVIDTLIAAIRESSTKKGEFRTSRIFPLQDGDGRNIPNYQAYLALRWLRQIGLIERVARQRYQMDPAGNVVECVESAWQSLPQR